MFNITLLTYFVPYCCCPYYRKPSWLFSDYVTCLGTNVKLEIAPARTLNLPLISLWSTYLKAHLNDRIRSKGKCWHGGVTSSNFFKMLWYIMCTLLTVKIDKEIFRLLLHNDPAFRMVVWRICGGFCCMCSLTIVKIDKIVF